MCLVEGTTEYNVGLGYQHSQEVSVSKKKKKKSFSLGLFLFNGTVFGRKDRRRSIYLLFVDKCYGQVHYVVIRFKRETDKLR